MALNGALKAITGKGIFNRLGIGLDDSSKKLREFSDSIQDATLSQLKSKRAEISKDLHFGMALKTAPLQTKLLKNQIKQDDLDKNTNLSNKQRTGAQLGITAEKESLEAKIAAVEKEEEFVKLKRQLAIIDKEILQVERETSEEAEKQTAAMIDRFKASRMVDKRLRAVKANFLDNTDDAKRMRTIDKDLAIGGQSESQKNALKTRKR